MSCEQNACHLSIILHWKRVNQERTVHRSGTEKQICWWILMWEDRGLMFSLDDVLWIMRSYFGQKQYFKVKRLDGFITDSFSLQKSLTDGLLTCRLLVDYVMFLSAVWTFILTAPIHCRGSIDDQVMLNLSKSVMIKKQIHLHLEWLKGEYILRVQIFILVNYSFKQFVNCRT